MKTDRNWNVVPALGECYPGGQCDPEVAAEYLTWFKERALRQAAWANKQAFKTTYPRSRE